MRTCQFYSINQSKHNIIQDRLIAPSVVKT